MIVRLSAKTRHSAHSPLPRSAFCKACPEWTSLHGKDHYSPRATKGRCQLEGTTWSWMSCDTRIREVFATWRSNSEIEEAAQI